MNNVDLVKHLYNSFANGDVGAVLGIMAGSITWREAEGNPYDPEGKGWTGPDAIVQNLFARLATEWDGFTVAPRSFHASGDSVIVEGRYTGTFLGTKREVNAQFCHVWTVTDERIQGFQQYTDSAQFQSVMGAR